MKVVPLRLQPGDDLRRALEDPSVISPGRPWPVAPDAGTIQHLHSTLRALPRPLLQSLTRACRKRFQVSVEAVTIADRINQKCRHDWIETSLVQHQASSG